MRSRPAGVLVAVCAVVLLGGCGAASEPGSAVSPDGASSGVDPRDLVAEAAVSGELAGLAEMTELVRRTLRDEPRVCGEPEPAAAERLALERRVFSVGTPEDDLVEVRQTTVAYAEAEAARSFVDESQRLLAACEEEVTEAEVTRDFEVVEMPGETGGEAVAAVMTTSGPGDEFRYRRGCVQRDRLVQCTQVWAVDDAPADRAFAEAVAEGEASLAAR